MILAVLLGCTPDVPGLDETACAEATARYGELVCVPRVDDRATWTTITTDGEAADEVRSTKFLMPAVDDAPTPTLIVDSNTFELHYDMMMNAFPDQFAGWTMADYARAVIDPAHRIYYSGNLNEYVDVTGGTFFGFTVWDDPADVSKTATYADVLAVYEEIQSRFTLGSLVFVPNSANQRAALESWPEDRPFPIRGDDGVRYEAYTTGVGYGTVRRYRLPELAEAEEEAAFGFQDILVLDDAPFDVQRPISGVVTGGRQGELSHLNVRSAARGTPNCFVADAWDRLADWDGQLVRLECGENRWKIEAAGEAEAEAFWEALRPDPVDVPTPDLAWTALTPLLELPTSTAEERQLGLTRYGSKGRNLATLYQRIDPDLQITGFLVPFSAYDGFVRAEREGGSFQDRIEAMLDDPTFLNDGAVRRETLDALVADMEIADVDPGVLAAVSAQVDATFGSDRIMVRVRSSSNAEDSLKFTGAGLYDSTSVCIADDRDDDDLGPSSCDPEQPDERGLRRGLARVWASLWYVRAYEERSFYGIDHRNIAMGVLVDTRQAHEQANMVAFTGNPGAPDDRFLVNAQEGEIEVVSDDPGVWPERDLLEMDGGVVTGVVRAGASSEVPQVLTDAELAEVGAALWKIRDVMPIDEAVPDGYDLLLDTEWKFDAKGRLTVKQVRPFLRAR